MGDNRAATDAGVSVEQLVVMMPSPIANQKAAEVRRMD